MRHIFVTGEPGCGKTTLVSNVVQLLRDGATPAAPPLTMLGFLTRELRKDGRREGFDVELVSGKTAPLARLAAGAQPGLPQVGRYAVTLAPFEAAVLPELQLADHPTTKARLIIIDEVGSMELLSPSFVKSVRGLVEAPATRDAFVFGTVAFKGQGFISHLKQLPTVDIFEISAETRDAVTATIFSRIHDALK
jgi:nucleoside-triphosphatase